MVSGGYLDTRAAKIAKRNYNKFLREQSFKQKSVELDSLTLGNITAKNQSNEITPIHGEYNFVRHEQIKPKG